MSRSRKEKVRDVVQGLAHHLHPDEPAEVSSMQVQLEAELGIGSADRAELLQRLESRLDTTLPERKVFQASTPAELVEIVSGREDPSGTPAGEKLSLKGEAPEVISSPSTLLDLLEYQVEHQPQRTYLHLVEEQHSVSFAEMRKRAARVATGLARMGVEAGDRVALMLRTGTDFFEVFFGALWLGAIPVPLYPPFRPDQAEDFVHRQRHILENCSPRLLVSLEQARVAAEVVHAHAPSLGDICRAQDLQTDQPARRHKAEPQDLGFIQYTSGSTGAPKGVALCHENLLNNLKAFESGFAIEPTDIAVSWLPLYHDMGLIGKCLGCLYFGLPLVLLEPQTFLARPSRWLQQISQHQAHLSAGPNFAYEICARKIPDEELEGLDLSSWRVALNGSEPVSARTVDLFTRRFAAFGFKPEAMFCAYGLAENGVAVSFPAVEEEPRIERISRDALEQESLAEPVEQDGVRIASCGRAVEGTEIRTIDAEGKTCRERQVGRVQFRGNSVLTEYYNNSAANQQNWTEDGWVDSGDLGYLADGELFLTGRSSDQIVLRGRNIYPEDLEQICEEVEGVRRGCVACFAVELRDQDEQELVLLAESYAKSDTEKEELGEALRSELSDQAGVHPDRIEILEPRTLPKTPSGKIRRGEARKRYLEENLSGDSTWRQYLKLVSRGGANLARKALRKSGRGLYGAWCWATLTCCFLVAGLVALFDRDTALRVAHTLGRLLFRSIGLQVRVRSRPELDDEQIRLLVSNHESLLDSLILICAYPKPLRFVTAPWVASHPVLRHFVRLLGHLPVKLGSGRDDIDRMRELLRETTDVAVFPEGRCYSAPGLYPFEQGVFRAAATSGALVQPVALKGTRKRLPLNSLIPNPGEVEVCFLDPAFSEEARELSRLARKRIQTALSD